MAFRLMTTATALLLTVLAVTVAAQASAAQAVGISREKSAAEAMTMKGSKAAKLEKQAKAFELAVFVMERHIVVSGDGTLKLNETALRSDLDNGKASGVDRQIFENLKSGLEQTNSRIRSGDVKAETVFPVAAVEASDRNAALGGLVEQGNSYTAAQSYCSGRGRTAFYAYWWGYRHYYSDCLTHKITDALKAGTGLGFLCAYAGWWAVPCGTVVGVSAFGAGLIDYVDRRGGHDGVVHVNPHGPGFYLRSQ